MWGVRLFDAASTAEKRRNFRGTRRRYDRRRQRIAFLQEIFNESIDSRFFQILKESKYREDDNINKTIKLTDEEQKKIKEYYHQYPTIYHLRKELIENQNKHDIKLVYLAIHHIIKYRGNFLYNNGTFSAKNIDIKEKLCNVFENIFNLLPSLQLPDNYRSLIDFNNIESTLLKESKHDIQLELKDELSSIFNNKFIIEFGKMIVVINLV